MVKTCSYALCNADSRYPERIIGVEFVPFPKPNKHFEKCQRWIKSCGKTQLDIGKINSNRYICTKHFVNKTWPTQENPDPVPFVDYQIQSSSSQPSPLRTLKRAFKTSLEHLSEEKHDQEFEESVELKSTKCSIQLLVDDESDLNALVEFLALLRIGDIDKHAPTLEWYENLRKDFDFTLTRERKDSNGFTFQGYLTRVEKDTIKQQGVLSDLTESIYEPVLFHNWKEVLFVLQQKVGDTKEDMYTIWKVGCELINKEQDKQTRCHLMDELYNEMNKQPHMNRKEMLLDYVLFAFSNADRERIKAELQKIINEEMQDSKDVYLDDLRQAYQGLFNYLEWKDCLKQEESLTNQTEQDSNSSFLVTTPYQVNKMQAKKYASRAIKLLSGIQDLDGVWDTFVDKFVEILVCSERQKDALKVLQDYSVKQETNLNAQKYLYYFYVKHFDEMEDEILQQLKVIAELSPADQLVLKYCKLVGDASIITPCLFSLLDYPVWQSEIKPWKLMANCLKRVCIKKEEGTEDAKQVMQECWKVRESWWPQYHFTQYIVSKDSNNLKLLQQKYKIASILCVSENEFTKLAEQALKQGGYKKNLKTFRKSLS